MYVCRTQGTRYDINEYPDINFVKLSRDYTRNSTIGEIRKVLDSIGSLHAAASADYFMIRRHSLILSNEDFLASFVPGGQRW